jgi:O-antigen/teichoic acid export membrane protein
MSGEFPDEPPVTLPADLVETTGPDVGLKVIRGTSIRGLGYGVGMALTALSSIFLLRYLGVADFGRYMTVTSIVAIAGGLTDAGLTAVGTRELATRSAEERKSLMANLLGLRLVVTPLGVVVAVVFALVAGYDTTIVLGTVVAGVGLVLIAVQGTMVIPLMVDLQIGRVTLIEVARQAAMLVGIVLLVGAGAGLLPFFGVSIGVGLVALGLMPFVAGQGVAWRPAIVLREWRTLVVEALPLAAAVVVGIIYFRLLIILMSLLSSDVETGLFATSFRVVEILYGIATLAVTVALPVLAGAAADRKRVQYMIQRLVEVSVISSTYLVLMVFLLAEPVLRILGGVQYTAAVPVLRIQSLALLPVFLGQVIVVGLIAVHRQSIQLIANCLAIPLLVVLGLTLIPARGAQGGAIAAVVAEFGFALSLLVLFVRQEPTLRPKFGFLWKIAIVSAMGAAGAFVPWILDLPSLVEASVATVAFAIGLLVTDAVPPEVRDAVRASSRSRQPASG